MAKQRYKKIQAGRLVQEILWTPVFSNSNPRERSVRCMPQTAARKKINQKKSWQQCRYLLAANFDGSCGVWEMNFSDPYLPPNLSEARKLFKKVIAQLRKRLREQGRELKYLYCLEHKHGEARIHFHVVVNLPASDIDLIKSLWPYGYAYSKALDTFGGYTDLAKYLTKEAREDGARVGAHSWAASRNLTKPTRYPAEWVPESVHLDAPPKAHVINREENTNEYGHFFYLEYFLPANDASQCETRLIE